MKKEQSLESSLNSSQNEIIYQTPEELIDDIVDLHDAEIVTEFYERLMLSDEARKFLDISIVHDRLSGSLLKWIRSVVRSGAVNTSLEQENRQKYIGAVHARINVPIHLVMQGALLIKTHIMQSLKDYELDTHTAIRATQIASERIDIAIMQMSEAYVQNAASRARLDEAFRSFSMPVDTAVEKDTQKASLFDWSQKTLFFLLRRPDTRDLDRLSSSPFGAWIRGRADILIEPSDIFRDLDTEIRDVDENILPALERGYGSDRRDIVAQLQATLDRVSKLVDRLFESLAAMESGRDPLTRVLNRRFLPSVLGRQIMIANEKATPLSIIMTDIDHFKQINDRYGHQVGDAVLRQAAQVITKCVKSHDFVFRYGGEEFLIVLPGTDVEHGKLIAEEIRNLFETEEFQIGEALERRVTVSLGLASHMGHPDQDYLIRSADDALYRAKKGGRNRVEIATV